ncbi:MAG: GNAT family N-acetyltransferase [Clostridiales bacterium]|nr:GNAT family N-acetyltransferase [Clostridiales bacterium]
MQVLSIRENPELKDRAIAYIQSKWANENSEMVYEDCFKHCIDSESPLPQWYLLMDEDKIVGFSGLITNDFISRMDLYPWICALYIEEENRSQAYGALLLEKAKEDSKKAGFSNLYPCSDHVSYYEKYGFSKIGIGYHPWGATPGVFQVAI